MTNFEKWRRKLAETTDGYELLETIDEMNKAHADMCFRVEINSCDEYADCEECKAKWLNEEANGETEQ